MTNEGAQGFVREASKNGNIEVVKLLLNDSRVNPSAEDNYGKSYNDLINIIHSNCMGL